VVRALAARGQPFRAGYRSRPQNVPAGVEAVPIDYDQPGTLAPALRGIETLFLLSATVAPEAEVVRAAAAAGVKRIVKLSVWAAGEPGFTFGAWHRAAEQAVEQSGVAWTFLRPNGFMQNVVNFMGQTIRSQGAMYSSAGDALVSHIDARDIGEVAARVLSEPGHEGKVYDLSGPAALGYDEMAAVLTRELGRPIRYVAIPDEDYKKAAIGGGVPEPYAEALVNLNQNYRKGRFSRVAPDVPRLLGRAATPFEQFARDHAGALR
jgi:uncharacterized protein YbjT (DUF2867 family)